MSWRRQTNYIHTLFHPGLDSKRHVIFSQKCTLTKQLIPTERTPLKRTPLLQKEHPNYIKSTTTTERTPPELLLIESKGWYFGHMCSQQVCRNNYILNVPSQREKLSRPECDPQTQCPGSGGDVTVVMRPCGAHVTSEGRGISRRLGGNALTTCPRRSSRLYHFDDNGAR
jgi:hypothetical protein